MSHDITPAPGVGLEPTTNGLTVRSAEALVVRR